MADSIEDSDARGWEAVRLLGRKIDGRAEARRRTVFGAIVAFVRSPEFSSLSKFPFRLAIGIPSVH